MKSYIIKIELEESNPLVWRRVIMPAGATFNRLHDVIQNTTNFQGGYPHEAYHLFAFDLPDRVVTNDDERYEEHRHFKKNRKYYEDRLKTIPHDMLEFEKKWQEKLKVEVRKPTGLKIDDSLEKYGQIRYHYDFGDDWRFIIKLEQIVDDYYFGYPTLLDGAETAPPEDVGGLDGFHEFMEIFEDENHPDHERRKRWAESQGFREYDLERINRCLRGIEYKKTQWDQIKHVNYTVMEDKYRK